MEKHQNPKIANTMGYDSTGSAYNHWCTWNEWSQKDDPRKSLKRLAIRWPPDTTKDDVF